jgi:hypothetical protein
MWRRWEDGEINWNRTGNTFRHFKIAWWVCGWWNDVGNMHRGLAGKFRNSVEGKNSKKMCTQSPRESLRHFFLVTGFCQSSIQGILHNAKWKKFTPCRSSDWLLCLILTYEQGKTVLSTYSCIVLWNCFSKLRVWTVDILMSTGSNTTSVDKPDYYFWSSSNEIIGPFWYKRNVTGSSYIQICGRKLYRIWMNCTTMANFTFSKKNRQQLTALIQGNLSSKCSFTWKICRAQSTCGDPPRCPHILQLLPAEGSKELCVCIDSYTGRTELRGSICLSGYFTEIFLQNFNLFAAAFSAKYWQEWWAFWTIVTSDKLHAKKLKYSVCSNVKK